MRAEPRADGDEPRGGARGGVQARVARPATSLTRKFLYNPLPVTELSARLLPEGGRVYTTPDGIEYPSVTTVLKNLPDPDPAWRDKWVGRVGEAEAHRVTERAKTRGNKIHGMVEAYLRGDPDFARGAMPVNLASFKQLRPVIDENLGSIYGVELPLYSHKLKTAGRCDLCAGFRGFNSVVDWKGSNSPWAAHRKHKALIQSAAYATMIEEAHPGLNIPQVVVVVMVEHGENQVFVARTDSYREMVRRVFVEREFG